MTVASRSPGSSHEPPIIPHELKVRRARASSHGLNRVFQ